MAFPHLTLMAPRELKGESVNALASQLADYFFESLRGERVETAWPYLFHTVPEVVGLGRRVDVDRHDLLRRLGRDFLDVHAAGLRGDEGDAARRAVDQDREVELALDRRAFLDVEALTARPAWPVWWVTSVRRHLLDLGDTSSTGRQRTPPFSPASASLKRPLPRPPAWICDFTTQIGPPSVSAASRASPVEKTAMPFGTGAPKPRSSSFAWYS
jgi:hypothetical protein